jgi:hypothetical protein
MMVGSGSFGEGVGGDAAEVTEVVAKAVAKAMAGCGKSATSLVAVARSGARAVGARAAAARAEEVRVETIVAVARAAVMN